MTTRLNNDAQCAAETLRMLDLLWVVHGTSDQQAALRKCFRQAADSRAREQLRREVWELIHRLHWELATTFSSLCTDHLAPYQPPVGE